MTHPSHAYFLLSCDEGLPFGLHCSFHLSFTYIIASIPRESDRQPAILCSTLLVTLSMDYLNGAFAINYNPVIFASYSCHFALLLISIIAYNVASIPQISGRQLAILISCLLATLNIVCLNGAFVINHNHNRICFALFLIFIIYIHLCKSGMQFLEHPIGSLLFCSLLFLLQLQISCCTLLKNLHH